MRIGIISIQHESNTFLSTPTTMDDFRADTLVTGSAVRDRFAGVSHEIGGFFAALDEAGVEAVPLLAAVAVPSGIITTSTEDELIRSMLEQLEQARSLSLDGCLVAPHGAAVSEAHPDMDGFWLQVLREHVGPDFPLIGTLDLHANVSQAMIDATDALIAYRSNPHLDQYERGREAASLMMRAVQGEISPVQALAAPAFAINIEKQRTAESPCRELYQFADQQKQDSRILSNSVVLGFPYADVSEFGTSLITVTDNDEALASRCVEDMANYLWQHRQDFIAELTSIDEALALTEQCSGTTCLLDMGDNVGGGSAADGTWLAQALHRYNSNPDHSQGNRKINAFVSLFDPQAVQQVAAAGPGKRLQLVMGGKTDNLHGPSLACETTVISLHDGHFSESQTRHGGRSSYDMGQTAIVKTDSGLTIQLTSKRIPPFSLGQLTSCDLDAGDFDAVVAKGVVAPVAAYESVCDQFIRVNTPGSTTADMLNLNYTRRRRPLFPFESG